jgi:hypothetical protein
MPQQTFGNRFLAEFRRLGGSTSDWPEQAVTVLDQADRRQFIDALMKASSAAASQLAIAAHTAAARRRRLTCARFASVSGSSSYRRAGGLRECHHRAMCTSMFF